MDKLPEIIVLYDGDCGFCSRVVQLVLKKSKRQDIYFTALGSGVSKRIFAEKGLGNPDMETFYLLDKNKLYDRSSAAMRLSRYLKFPYSILTLGRVVPRFISNPVYNLIARNRHKLMGQSCFIPDEHVKNRFLD